MWFQSLYRLFYFINDQILLIVNLCDLTDLTAWLDLHCTAWCSSCQNKLGVLSLGSRFEGCFCDLSSKSAAACLADLRTSSRMAAISSSDQNMAKMCLMEFWGWRDPFWLCLWTRWYLSHVEGRVPAQGELWQSTEWSKTTNVCKRERWHSKTKIHLRILQSWQKYWFV